MLNSAMTMLRKMIDMIKMTIRYQKWTAQPICISSYLVSHLSFLQISVKVAFV